MKHETSVSVSSLTHDLWLGLLLLGISIAGAWTASLVSQLTGAEALHLRLLIALLVHPFALAAWLFCGLPGLALAVKSLMGAMEKRSVVAGLCSVGLLALSLACVSFWI
ncbi:hypothetical protein SAMN02745166_01218 [Prosthecobacter debontii]|uniref:Uncharacterized protein n=1 Tax=Prosthecobacter debontii TaxID=48467 RepID=A0A1T4X9U4_9BACT|nr:hypothetical protein [Prosthecobacter debontii]SKA85865.1 hypothetical protein SAMN02745166_01218 [Prosthecobacter debontii]